ncbi:putative ribonuclease H-like domain-containing protein [Tanacetum coccineum]
METIPGKDYILLPLWTADPPFSQSSKSSLDVGFKPSSDDGKKVDEDPRKESECNDQEKEENVNNTNFVNAASINKVNAVSGKTSIELPTDLDMHELEDIVYLDDDEDVGAEAEMNNLDAFMPIEEEVYVCQPPGFEDPDFLDRVYKVERLYGCIKILGDMISFLDIQRNHYAREFDEDNDRSLQMSSMGELTFFLGLQVKQKEDGIFISQEKYVTEILKKFSFTDCKKQTVVANSTTEAEYVAASSCRGQVLWIQNQLLDYGDCNEKKLIQMVKIHTGKNIADLLTKAFDVKKANKSVRLMVEKLSDLVSKRIERNGKNSQLLLKVNAARHKLTTADENAEGVDCLPKAAIFEQLTLMSAKTTAWNEFSSTMASAIIYLATNQKFNFLKYIFESMVKNLDSVGKFLMYPRKQRPRKPKRKDIEIPQSSGPTNNVADKAVNEEMDDSLERAATTATSLDAEQDRVVITPRSDEDRLKLQELMELSRVESSDDELSLGEDASKQGRKIHDIDADEDITLENVHDDEMFDVNDLHGEEVFAEKEVPVKEVSAIGKVNVASIATTVSAAETITTEEITLAQALAALKSAKPKDDKVMIQEPEQGTVTTTVAITVIDKGKGIMVEEPLKMKKKDQVSFDEQEARRLLVEFDEEDRIVREKDEANVALTEEWNDIQAKIEADQLLAERLQAREQEELTIE